jgi:hypothetical protein
MANNYQQFSEVFEFKTKEGAKLFGDLQEIVGLLEMGDVGVEELDGEEELPEDSDYKDLVKVWQTLTEDQKEKILATTDDGSFDCEPEKGAPKNVWVYADECGNLEALAACAQAALEVTKDTDTVFTLTWSATCDKPRVGNFGGGWIVMHAHGVEFGDAWSAAKEAVKKIKGE